MSTFSRDPQGRARLGECLIADVLVQQGLTTPTYLYDLDAIAQGAAALVAALGSPGHVAYAVKANSAGSILRTLFAQGVGADVVSGAELALALRAGAPPKAIVMSGVAKTDAELDLALGADLRALQLESVEEVARVAARARSLGKTAWIALRVNPNVAVSTHAHVATGHDRAKFGIPLDAMPQAFAEVDARPELSLVGISTHVGSTLMATDPYLDSARVVCGLARQRRAAGRPVQYVNFGGGFGVDYGRGTPPAPAEFARAARALWVEWGLEDHELIVEPGRCLVAAHAVLVARVVQTKVTGTARWLMLDAGMNDLLRPALYGAHHRIEALDGPPAGEPWQVVGPVCESADDFGAHVVSPNAPAHVVIRDAGAYGFTMASNYNGRPLPAEAFISGGRIVHSHRADDEQRWVEARLRA